VALIAASWHTQVMDGLLDGARRALAESGVEAVTEIRVPGTFELPVAAARAALPHDAVRRALGADTGQPAYDAVVALGVVIRGGTPHFEYVCEAATMGLTDVSVRSGIPVGFGVLTCDDDAQALDRAGLPGSSEDKGYEAAHAAISTAIALRAL
jgi:6,7-dimethyl-8-ribityllumazine synthase